MNDHERNFENFNYEQQSASRITRPPAPPPLFMNVGRYAASAENTKVVGQAIKAYVHLLPKHHVPGTTLRVNFSQFADYIEAFLTSPDESQRNTLRVLREVHAFNTSYPLPRNGDEQLDNAICLSDDAKALWPHPTCAGSGALKGIQ